MSTLKDKVTSYISILNINVNLEVNDQNKLDVDIDVDTPRCCLNLAFYIDV